MDEQDVEMNENAGITSDESTQNLPNGEADVSAEKNKESSTERSSVESEDDCLNETSTEQEMEVFIKPQEGQLPSHSKRSIDDTQVEHIELAKFRRYTVYETQMEQNFPNGEADASAEKNKESSTERSSVESEDDCLNETSTEQEMEVLIKSQEGKLPNHSKRLDDTQVKQIEPTESRHHPIHETQISLPNFSAEINKESLSERSSVESGDDCLNETSTEQEMEVLIKSHEEQLPNNRKRRLENAQLKYIEPTKVERCPVFETFKSNVLEDRNDNWMNAMSSKRIVEQAMGSLKLVEDLQENGQYDEALSHCQSALHLLDLSQDTNLRMKFCSNMMQLYFLMENIDEAFNTYYDYCVHVLECTSDIDPKVIQTIMDLHTLCMKKLEGLDEMR